MNEITKHEFSEKKRRHNDIYWYASENCQKNY